MLPNISTHALLRAIGLDLATPRLVGVEGLAEVASPVSGNRGARTAAAVQYAPANHGLGYDRYARRDYLPGVPVEGDTRFPKLPSPFVIEMPIREHSAQLAGFLGSANEGKAVIEVTAPAVADYDGDGALDEKDADPIDPETQ